MLLNGAVDCFLINDALGGRYFVTHVSKNIIITPIGHVWLFKQVTVIYYCPFFNNLRVKPSRTQKSITATTTKYHICT